MLEQQHQMLNHLDVDQETVLKPSCTEVLFLLHCHEGLDAGESFRGNCPVVVTIA